MKLLITLSRFPYPLEKGDKLRSFHQIKYLSNHFEIYLFCLSIADVKPAHIKALEPYCKQIKIVRLTWFGMFKRLFFNLISASKIPLQVSLFKSDKIQDAFDKYFEEVLPQMLFCQLIRTAHLAKKYTIYPRVIDYMDALSLGMRRRMEMTKNPIKKIIFSREFRLLEQYEIDVFKHFEGHIIIAEQDKQHILHPQNHKIKVIPNGVDLAFFKPIETLNKYDICFVGNMAYPPNIEAAKFLVNEVIPILQRENKTIKCLLSGANPSNAVKNLADGNTVFVKGWVDDIRKSYCASKIFVAPMHLGSGLQNKLLEAMSLHLPCITSPIANESLGAIDKEEIILANSAEEFAAAIELLLADENLRKKLQIAGNKFVNKNYNWDDNNKKLLNFLKESI